MESMNYVPMVLICSWLVCMVLLRLVVFHGLDGDDESGVERVPL